LNTDPCRAAAVLLDIVERSMHSSRSEWLFFRELRVGTGRRTGNVQRFDAFALNSLPHTGMKRVCYEVKASRSDFLAELKHPLKRRIGMRYSSEFYFVTPADLVDVTEIPVRAGGSWSRHGGRMEAANPAAGWVFQLRSGYAALLHDQRSGAVARHARPDLATGGRHVAESAARIGGEAASAASTATAHVLGSFTEC
jgi:hypothetical protein